MNFSPLPIVGAWIIDATARADDRGSFSRTYCRDEFLKNGLNPTIAQCSISRNRHKATLRGLHFQKEPFGEIKLVRCVRGAVFDVLVDLRADSPTFKQWTGVELTEENDRSVYIPNGVAHGFQTLIDHSDVHYQIATPYVAEAASGVRWNDPAFRIAWPLAVQVISDRDAHHADFE